MAIVVGDIKYRKSVSVSDIASNGGRKGQTEVVSGVRHSLFPRVTKSERLAGVTRYRKEFWSNENSDDDIAYGVLQWIEVPSNAGDHFLFKEGTQTDIQSDLTSPAAGTVPLWLGSGTLNTLLSGGETQIILDMEDPAFVFENGGYLHLADKVKTGQTIASDVIVGDSVTFSATWTKVTATDDITYPAGLYLGSNKVLTLETTTNEEWLTIAENLYTNEDVGTGDSTAFNPALTTLSHITNGICQVEGKLPVVTATDKNDAAMTAYFNADGTLITATSDASLGVLNMATGEFTTDITWDVEPKTATDIFCTYREKPYKYATNVVTIDLDDTISNAYATANTVAGGCTYSAEITALSDSWVETSGTGTYDETTYPVVLHNDGAEEETITITFTDATTFGVVGSNSGSLGTGFLISAACTPTNPTTGLDMFTIALAGWAGTWAIGDTVVFDVHPSAQGIWVKEVVPASTAQESNNLIVFGWYAE